MKKKGVKTNVWGNELGKSEGEKVNSFSRKCSTKKQEEGCYRKEKRNREASKPILCEDGGRGMTSLKKKRKSSKEKSKKHEEETKKRRHEAVLWERCHPYNKKEKETKRRMRCGL